jgi:hypothetical protein
MLIEPVIPSMRVDDCHVLDLKRVEIGIILPLLSCYNSIFLKRAHLKVLYSWFSPHGNSTILLCSPPWYQIYSEVIWIFGSTRSPANVSASLHARESRQAGQTNPQNPLQMLLDKCHCYHGILLQLRLCCPLAIPPLRHWSLQDY